MKNRPILAEALAAGLALAAAWPAHAQSAAIAQGPLIGAVTAKSAAVWVRLSAPGQVRARWLAPNGTQYSYSAAASATVDGDDTARVDLPNLASGKTYTYQVGVTGADGIESWSGIYSFSTVPSTVSSVSFAVLSDFSNKLKGSPALRDALAHRPDFLAVVGDLDHRNPASSRNGGIYPPEDAPHVLADLRAMHRDTRDFGTPIGSDFANGLIGLANSSRAQIPLYYGWDDHDFCTNNADVTCPFASQAVQAAREYYVYPDDNGIDGKLGCAQASSFQHFDYGRLLSVFILDARSARDEKLDTMLGTCQYNWLTQGLANSKALWKVVLTPVPFNPTVKTWDAWGAFPAERNRLLAFIQQKGLRNLVFLSGDVHSGGAVDDGTHAGWPEVAVPHANMPDDWINTYCITSDSKTVAHSQPGLWTLGTLVEPDFDNTAQPTCQGDPLAPGTQLIYPAQGVYALSGKGNAGYVRVDVDSTSLTASVISSTGAVRAGQRADGSSVPLVLHLTAQ